MKIIYITTAALRVYLIKVKFFHTYDKDIDTFKKRWLGLIALVLAVIFTPSYRPMKFLWTFSIWLESIAIFPQLLVLTRKGKCKAITGHYMFALGLYRGFYVFNWIYKWWTTGYFQLAAFLAGIVQTGFYCEFLHLYIKKIVVEGKYDLPMGN